MKIAIGSDHAGFELKSTVIEAIRNLHDIKDFGPSSADRVDYPDFAHPVATAVENGEYELGILICGSANGICMTANKHQGIRAAVCWETEIAALARQHNNANIICLPARFIEAEKAINCVEVFLKEPFEGGRHETRVNKISC
jgi:ribose 5-phosphate isomerase B